MEREYRFEIGGRAFNSGTHIMGILNATPDSFYDKSRLIGDVTERVEYALKYGASVIDVGGQSTRPNACKVDEHEELSRVLPVVKEIKSAYPNALLSVDTFYPSVALKCIEEGADMINDVSCLRFSDLAKIVADGNISVCIMHDRRVSNDIPLFDDKIKGLSVAIDKLLGAGVKENKILLDGGIGFNKSKEEDWELLSLYPKLMDRFKDYPFLLGTSRKSMFGGDVQDRLDATLKTTEFAKKIGVLFVRVHDVKENAEVLKSEDDIG